MRKTLHWFWEFAQLVTPCFDGLLAWYNGIVVNDSLKDATLGRGTHAATKAVSLGFSGAQYVTLAEAITLVGDFKVSGAFNLSAFSTNMTLTGSDSINEGLIWLPSTGNITVFIGGSAKAFTELSVVTGVVYSWELARVGSNLTLTLNDSSQTLTTGLDDFIIRYLGKWEVSTHPLSGNLWDIYAEDSTGVKLHNYLAQKSDTGYIESVVGPAVQLNGFTLPDDFTESSQYGHSWNRESYFEGVSGKIPEDPDNLGYAVTGEALNRIGTAKQDMAVTGSWTGNILDAPGGTVTISAPETLEYWNADGTINKWLDASGVAIARDPALIESNYINQYFLGSTIADNTELVNYSAPITGACLIRTENYNGS